MFVNQVLSRRKKADQNSIPPVYSLKQFSLPEYSDPIVPVQIMMVMMGFTILLINGIFRSGADLVMTAVAVLSGVIYLISFMFYLTEYYEKLWEPYFLLPEDKLFFRLYSVLVGIVVISLMSKWPEYWALYMIALFLVMYFKKSNTKRKYHRAVNHEFGSYLECDKPKIKSCYVLVDTFTRNFFYLGIVFLLPFALLMAMAAALVLYPKLLIWLNGYFGFAISISEARAIYVGTSISVSLLTAVFWSKKLISGLQEMKSQIELGHYAYFESRDIRSRLRRGRNPYRG
jgi:hypothetical protein